MPDIVAERSGSILRIQLNRPAKKNALTSSMYSTMAELLDDAAKDDRTRVVLWHGAGDPPRQRRKRPTPTPSIACTTRMRTWSTSKTPS